MPDLRQLRAFVAVAEELNFTHAAERLHLGQQAVSKTVSQLERELGVELLERTTREVRLTTAGSALLARGREALVAADAAFDVARAVGRGLAGAATVRLAELDGERLLTWSRRGTPYTDLLLDRVAAAGSVVEPVQARVTGAGDLSELAERGAVALTPVGWPQGEGSVQLDVLDEMSLAAAGALARRRALPRCAAPAGGDDDGRLRAGNGGRTRS